MWRRDARRKGPRAALWAITALALVGARKGSDTPPKVEEAITNVAEIQSRVDLRLEGVGLVVGLDKTGGDTPPSWARERLVDEMRKAGVEHPEKLLTDPTLSIVIVRANVPTGTTNKDRLDVEVQLPPASGTTSLAGGYLVSCRLKEIMIAGGTPREGNDLATAQGPVMIGTEARPDDPKVGRVLGGARVKKDSPFRIDIKENRRSFKTSQLIQQVVNRRFHQTEGVKQNGMATAKTDSYLELRIPQVYHHNHYRYFRVLRLLPLVDTPALRAARTVAWGKDLLEPTQAGIAALRLEGLGVTSVDTLKAGLASPHELVKFFAAEALAYLNDASGADVLAETAVKRPEFRAYALAALAATDQPAARMKLIKLMDVADIPVRYGAFDALRTLDESDPFLGRVRVIDEAPPVEPEESESMSLAIAGAMSRRRPAQEEPFALYVVDSDGPPMVHVARTRRCEIVVFGRNQKLLTPIVLGNGPILLNASDGDEALQISKISSGRPGDDDAKVQASLDVADVIRRTANLGAKYPDVVAILQAASRQKNMAGPLVVDAIPGPTADYDAAAILGKDTTKKDEQVTQTKHETSRWPRLFRGFSRTKTAPKPPEAKADDPKADDPKADDPKKDDAVTRSGLEPPAQKPRLIDRILRRPGN